MRVRNIHTGKEFNCEKEKFDAMDAKYKKAFTIVDDKEEPKPLVVPEAKQTVVADDGKGGKGKKDAPETGEKKK